MEPGAADRNDDQEGHHVAQRIIGLDRQQFGADDAAERRQADGNGEADRIDDLGAHAERGGHGGVVDRGAQLHAEGRPLDRGTRAPAATAPPQTMANSLCAAMRAEAEVDGPAAAAAGSGIVFSVGPNR